MKILSIETSCDETAVSVIEAKGTISNPSFKVLGNALYSQIDIHAQYGGVFPMLAKREHSKNITPLLIECLKQTKLLKIRAANDYKFPELKIKKILNRETELIDQLHELDKKYMNPNVDAIAVTFGPGLEPALWVGITFAKALSVLWNVPVVPINHMEGHIVSVLFAEAKNFKIKKINYPGLALLISGGHTELVYSKSPLSYKLIGKTRDDAIGEAYDKVARMIGLPYPGGPEISKLAEQGRSKELKTKWNLPRPMIHSKDFDFSFSGLKTSVLYKIRDNGKLSLQDKISLAREFEDAVTEVLLEKTKKAIIQYRPKSLIIGGGVISNNFIRSNFEKLALEYTNLDLYIPEQNLSTDNSIMIGIAGYLNILNKPKILKSKKKIVAEGNASL